MKYRKKPVVVEAMGWSGSIESAERIAKWSEGAVRHDRETDTLVVETLEGTRVADQFDYIVKGVAGEFYPCKPDIFEALYEAVEES